MPGRQSHGRQSHGRSLSTGPKKTNAPNRRSKARAQATALDAYNIAAKQFPQKEKRTPRSRFLNPEDDDEEEDGPSNRRKNNNDDDEDDEDEAPRGKHGRRPDDGSDVEYGSDESGNQWRINGRPNDDEDSELDSDEAFGESDEEKFADFTFGGSKSKPKKKAADSDDEEDEEAYDDDDASSLGSDAVDLATALDMAEEESSEEEKAEDADSESGSGDSDSEDDSEDDSEEESDDDVDGPSRKKVSLNDLANEFAGFDDEDDDEDVAASGKQKISLGDLGLIKSRDADIRKSVKLLSKEENDARGANTKLTVPLAPLQQAQVTRKVAFEKTADTLDRWTETIKHNRRADHLQFPLLQDTPNASLSTKEFRPITVENATNELEKTMLDLLAQSGMSLERPKKKPVDEDGNELTPEQIKELVNKRRLEREMRSREEKRSKRIKKIKSKAYHRVHRKQAQKDEMAMRAEMEANGELDSEAEREDAARKRALERVGARHRDSKWAKANSKTKRAAWDPEYRENIEDMARREIELKRRVDGKDSSDDDDYSDSDDDSANDENEGDEKARLRRQLAKLKAERDDGPTSQLNKLDFMQRIESQRGHENDAMIREIERMLNSGDEEESDPEGMINGQVGRRTFGGPVSGELAGDEDAMDVDSEANSDDDGEKRPKKIARTAAVSALVRKNDKRAAAGQAVTEEDADEVQFVLDKAKDAKDALNTGEAWATAPRAQKPSRKSKVAASSAARTVELDIDAATATVLGGSSGDVAVAGVAKEQSKKRAAAAAAAAAAADTSSSEGSDSEDDAGRVHHPLALRSEHDLIARAFAGGDVVDTDFAAEKEAVAAEQDDQVIDNTLPGWGAWVGDGVGAREANKHRGKFTSVVAGVKRKDRRDAKLTRVIINEKRVKKNDKYLASQLPHKFENSEQYERSLRAPVGPEWMTKETFQASTKPRVLLKQGIIKPMSRPML